MPISTVIDLKAPFWGLFKTYFYGHFRKLFLFTKFEFLNFGKKFFLNYQICCYQNMHKHYYILIKSVICFSLMVTKHTNIFYQIQTASLLFNKFVFYRGPLDSFIRTYSQLKKKNIRVPTPTIPRFLSNLSRPT